MKYIKLTLMMLSSLFLYGCWDYRELNNMSILTMVGVDKVGNNYITTMQIVNAKKGASGGSESSSSDVPVIVYTAEGKSVHESLRKTILKLPKRAYIGHLDALVFGEDLVMNNDVTSYIDFFLRFPESRRVYKVLTVQGGKASDFLKILTPFVKIPGTYVHNLIEENSNMQGTLSYTTLDDFYNNIALVGNEPIMAAFKINGNIEEGSETTNTEGITPKTEFEISGLTVFKNNRAIGFLSPDESIGYSFIKGNFNSGTIPFSCDEENNQGTISISTTKSGSKIEIKNNHPFVKIKVKVNSFLSELNCNIRTDKPSDLKKIEDMASNTIKNYIKTSLDVVQNKFNSDIFGFGLSLYRNNNKYWKLNKDKWDSIFPKIDYEINVDVVIEQVGSSAK